MIEQTDFIIWKWIGKNDDDDDVRRTVGPSVVSDWSNDQKDQTRGEEKRRDVEEEEKKRNYPSFGWYALLFEKKNIISKYAGAGLDTAIGRYGNGVALPSVCLFKSIMSIWIHL